MQFSGSFGDLLIEPIGFLELIVGHIIFESRKECNDVEGNEGY